MVSIKNRLVACALSMAVLVTLAARAAEPDEQRTSSRFTFTVHAQTHDLGSWSRVTGLDATWDLAEYRSDGAAHVSRWHVPRPTNGTVTLSRAASADTHLVVDWLSNLISIGDSTTLSITLFNQDGKAVVSWQFDKVVPQKFVIEGLGARGPKIATERLVLSHEGITVVCERTC